MALTIPPLLLLMHRSYSVERYVNIKLTFVDSKPRMYIGWHV